MSAAHTPGPWEVVADGDVLALVIRSIPGPTDSLSGEVCHVQFDESDEEHPAARRKLADANLIAAAPDLLAALQGVLRVADRATDEFAAARAAIAKAVSA